MKLKLDENLGERGRGPLQQAGHDVATVPDQALTSATDADLIRVCMEEGRALVTLDLDFANPLRFRPSQYAGIAVLRLPDKPSATDLDAVIRTLIAGLAGAQAQPSLPLGDRHDHGSRGQKEEIRLRPLGAGMAIHGGVGCGRAHRAVVPRPIGPASL